MELHVLSAVDGALQKRARANAAASVREDVRHAEQRREVQVALVAGPNPAQHRRTN